MRSFSIYGKKIHFVGINGVGVNALAKYALANGAVVSGSDRKLGDFCKPLIDAGCDIKEGENLSALKEADALVYTSAVSADNPELLLAKQLGIAIFERHEFLNLIARDFERVVAISGSHGKTTVTAMLAHVLKMANANFAAMIGGDAINYSNFVNNTSGGKSIFVTEACEFRRHMLALDYDFAVLLNTDWDHPDTYQSRECIEQAFAEFLQKGKTRVFQGGKNQVIAKCNDETKIFEAEEIGGHARVFVDGNFVGTFGENLKGEYNNKNALFALATTCMLGVPVQVAIKALNTFEGVKRRFEKVGDIDGVPVVFDFAHHPTEIKSVLGRASAYGKILAVFQPHTYSRTKAYLDDFAQVFADEKAISVLILLPTYAAREPQNHEFDSDAIMARILSKNAKQKVYVAENAMSSVEFAKIMAKDVGIVLFVGAGDIYDLKGCFC